MTKLYKLTDSKDETKNATQWGKGVTHTAAGGERPLCSDAWLHAYSDPTLALLMNPVHARFEHPHLWEAEGMVGKDEGSKVGCTELTTVRRIRKPKITLFMRRKFAVLVALEVYDLWAKYDTRGVWKSWAADFLAGRSTAAAHAAAHAAADAAAHAAYAAAAAHAAYARKIDLAAIARKACK